MNNGLISKIKGKCVNLIKFGKMDSQIVYSLQEEFRGQLSSEDLNNIIKDCIDEFKNYGLIQKIMGSELVCDQLAETNYITILDNKSRKVSKIHRTRLLELFSPKFSIKDRIITAEYAYLPYDAGMLIKMDDGSYSFNTYQPPEWYSDHFYSKGSCKIPMVSKMPEEYEKFLTHLVGGDSKSFDYVVKWLANGLRSRNYCILATIGQQGIGKGVLGNIMRELFGSSNFYAGGDRMFKGTFNSQLAGKRLVYCDEIYIKSKEDEDRVKLVVNDHLEIEQKGIDAKEVVNFANFYISSNNMDSISLTADDRRFSIVNLTNKKLSKVFVSSEIESLFEESNISRLAHYLWNYPIDTEEMLRVFTSERTEEVRSRSLKEWEEWFVFKFCSSNIGKILEIWEAADVVKEQFGYSFRIGRGKFMDLMKKYPEKFIVKNSTVKGNRVWLLEVLNGEKESKTSV